MSITEGQWDRWKANSTTDDRLNTYVLSDIRMMLGEIEWLRRRMKGAEDEVMLLRGEIKALTGHEAIQDTRWAENVLLEKIAAEFEANDTWDIWRSDAAALVRSHKHDLSALTGRERRE